MIESEDDFIHLHKQQIQLQFLITEVHCNHLLLQLKSGKQSLLFFCMLHVTPGVAFKNKTSTPVLLKTIWIKCIKS